MLRAVAVTAIAPRRSAIQCVVRHIRGRPNTSEPLKAATAANSAPFEMAAAARRPPRSKALIAFGCITGLALFSLWKRGTQHTFQRTMGASDMKPRLESEDGGWTVLKDTDGIKEMEYDDGNGTKRCALLGLCLLTQRSWVVCGHATSALAQTMLELQLADWGRRPSHIRLLTGGIGAGLKCAGRFNGETTRLN